MRLWSVGRGDRGNVWRRSWIDVRARAVHHVLVVWRARYVRLPWLFDHAEGQCNADARWAA